MRLPVAGFIACAAIMAGSGSGSAGDCSSNPDALGVSRVIEVDTARGPRFGLLQYDRTLDLGPKEVVLTFDDGPRPRHTQRILRALDKECVKATFFPIGVWARHIPHVLQMVADRGHTIGAHSWSHPGDLGRLSLASARKQIERGFEAVQAATTRPIAPFFRYPGLNDTRKLNAYLSAKNIAVFSCDIPTDDWRGIGWQAILQRTLVWLRRRGRGIILLHDTKAATAKALPALLVALKKGGYKVVHIVPRKPYDAVPPAVAVAQAGTDNARAEGLLETP